MKELILIRHAKSSWNHPGLGDFDRPLNGRGERDAPLMGGVLASQGPCPDHIIASPAKRARMTAIAIAEAIGFPTDAIEWREPLYLASPDTLFAQIRHVDSGIKRLALIAHNPGLTVLANRLAAKTGSGTANLPTCGIARFQLEINAWSEAGPECIVTAAFDNPKQHRPKA
jgi:phosphohistidine phosphatase